MGNNSAKRTGKRNCQVDPAWGQQGCFSHQYKWRSDAPSSKLKAQKNKRTSNAKTPTIALERLLQQSSTDLRSPSRSRRRHLGVSFEY
jgi:hypothetical protein